MRRWACRGLQLPSALPEVGGSEHFCSRPAGLTSACFALPGVATRCQAHNTISASVLLTLATGLTSVLLSVNTGSGSGLGTYRFALCCWAYQMVWTRFSLAPFVVPTENASRNFSGAKRYSLLINSKRRTEKFEMGGIFQNLGNFHLVL